MYPEFAIKMDAWKEGSDARVERSCYESAIGYSCPEEKIFIHEGQVIRVQTTKHYPPNPVSQIFWLTNRKHGDWKRTRQETGADPLSVKILTMIKNNGGGNGKAIKRGEESEGDVKSVVTIERGMQIVD